VTTITYDALDRPTQTSIGGITVTSRYDAGGRLVERADATRTTTSSTTRRTASPRSACPQGGSTPVPTTR
ncbi:MAG: hypothetical protein M3507_06675, partial [Actinomycetota bacterium]|nr:hypothetical protein [Actinomycetota bacterium]